MSDATAPILDEGALRELRQSVDGDRGFVVELIEAYLADGAAQVSDIEAALAAGDAEALVRPAHTLKSSSATVGAARLSVLARELEAAGRSGTLDAATTNRGPELRAAWEAAADALRRWIGGGAAT